MSVRVIQGKVKKRKWMRREDLLCLPAYILLTTTIMLLKYFKYILLDFMNIFSFKFQPNNFHIGMN